MRNIASRLTNMLPKSNIRSLLAQSTRSVHQRGYNHWIDIEFNKYEDNNQAVQFTWNTEELAKYLSENKDTMTMQQISFAFKKIAEHKLSRTPEFWDIILPLVKNQLQAVDRHTKAELAVFIDAAG